MGMALRTALGSTPVGESVWQGWLQLDSGGVWGSLVAEARG